MASGMIKVNTLEKYLAALLDGDRNGCRSVIEDAMQSGVPANRVYMDIIWPIMVEVERLYKQDVIDSAQEAFASRINRTIVDQLQNKLPRKTEREKKVVVVSPPDQNCELGGQMMADLFESDGWDVRFVGGSVNNDDILNYIHKYRPDALLLYGMKAIHAPDIRQLIDKIRSINAWPDMRIVMSGGVFMVAEGLWEEIGADMYAANAEEAVRIASMDKEVAKKPQRTIKRRKKSINKETDKTVQAVTV